MCPYSVGEQQLWPKPEDLVCKSQNLLPSVFSLEKLESHTHISHQYGVVVLNTRIPKHLRLATEPDTC